MSVAVKKRTPQSQSPKPSQPDQTLSVTPLKKKQTKAPLTACSPFAREKQVHRRNQITRSRPAPSLSTPSGSLQEETTHSCKNNSRTNNRVTQHTRLKHRTYPPGTAPNTPNHNHREGQTSLKPHSATRQSPGKRQKDTSNHTHPPGTEQNISNHIHREGKRNQTPTHPP
jgi:hypothetical protein